MIRIGLIGEDPNDTKAIENLLKQKYDFHFKTISRNQTGSKMFNNSAVKSYNLELSALAYNCIIIIVDADAVVTESVKIKEKKKLYEDLAKKLDRKSLLLLNIYELEALILADIAGFNKHYQTTISFSGNVAHQQKPKEYLQQKTAKKYKVSDCEKLFRYLSFDTIMKNCAYFKSFIHEFEAAVKN